MTALTIATNIFRNTLEGLNPFGPIFEKELWTCARRRRHFVLRTVYVLVLLGVMGFSLIEYDSFRSNNLAWIAGMSGYGLQMVVTIGIFQFFALQLITPALTGYALAEEIRKQTLSALMMTPLTGLQIYLGKLLSRMLMILLLVATTFPLLAIVRVFGGIEWNLVVALEGLTVLAALFSAALTLTASTFFSRKQTDPAGFTALFMLLIYLLVPVILMAVHNGYNWPGRMERYFAYFNPFYSILMVVDNAYRSGTGGYPYLSAPLYQCGLLFLATGLTVLIGAARIRRLGTAIMVGTVRQPAEPSSASPAGVRTGLYTAREMRVPEIRLLNRLFDYPVLWRELRRNFWRTPLRRNLFLVVFLGGLIASYVYVGYVTHYDPYHEDEDFRPISTIYVEVLMLLTLGAAASAPGPAVAREKETNTLEMLALTSLTPREIVWQKLFGILPRVVPWLVLFLFHLLASVIMGWLSILQVVELLITLAGPLVFLLGLGISFSVTCKTIRSATSWTQAVAFLLWVPLCCPLQEIMMVFNPFVLAGMIVIRPSEHEMNRFLQEYLDLGNAVSRILFLVVISFLFALVGYFRVRYAASRFTACVRRASRA